MSKIVITGKYGLLSTELQRLDPNILPLPSKEFDIKDNNIIDKLITLDPDTIIHAAALTDSTKVKSDHINFIQTNIIGTAYISQYCLLKNKRLVYISTDYIYPGVKGNYKEIDPILPVNDYAWTKLGGECSAKLVPNHLIIRTSFGSNVFPYKKAWTNQMVSKDYVDIIAPMILKASMSDITGILNIGTEAKSVYEYAKRRNNVIPTQNQINKNFTLNVKKYIQTFSN